MATIEIGDVITPDALGEITDRIGAKMRDDVVSQVTTSLTAAIREQVTEIVRGEVQEFVQQQVLPEVRDALLTKRETLIAEAVSAADEIARLLREKLVERVTKQLANEYNVNAMLKGIFGSIGY